MTANNTTKLVEGYESNLTAPKNVKCPVPKNATFSPWNRVRNQADGLRYKTVSKLSSVSITGDVKITAQNEGGIDGKAVFEENPRENDL